MKITDRDHPFYRPLWRRIAIVAVVALWAAYEIFVARESFWIMLAVGFLAYSVWLFLITWSPGDGNPQPPPEP
jgi:hypothetical protein